MSRQREFQQRLSLYHELQDIMGAMKNMAQAEIHKLRRRQQQQQACLDSVAQAAHAVRFQATQLGFKKEPNGRTRDLYLVIGSERGFCGGFNEALIRYIDGLPRPPMKDVILVGARLISLTGDNAQHAECVMGATAEKQVPATLHAALSGFQRLQQQNDANVRLTAICHDLHEVREVSLFPLPDTLQANPLTNASHESSNNALGASTHPRQFQHLEPLPVLARHIENHYLYHALLAVLYTSLYAENHRRLMQMEGALQHLDELSQQLKMRINAQRQEEIVEEIEVIFSSAPTSG